MRHERGGHVVIPKAKYAEGQFESIFPKAQLSMPGNRFLVTCASCGRKFYRSRRPASQVGTPERCENCTAFRQEADNG